jgi:hypothetical protein
MEQGPTESLGFNQIRGDYIFHLALERAAIRIIGRREKKAKLERDGVGFSEEEFEQFVIGLDYDRVIGEISSNEELMPTSEDMLLAENLVEQKIDLINKGDETNPGHKEQSILHISQEIKQRKEQRQKIWAPWLTTLR